MSKLCIKNGMVHDAVKEEAYQADILVEDGVIREIAPNLTVDGETEVVDASGLQVYPGFVEAHCHLGLDGYAIGYEGQDYNEYTDILTPHLNAVDGINPLDPSVRMAAKGGVTCVCTGPGSSNVLGGYFVAIKTTGSRVENMIVKEKVAMKCAFGENPKRCYREKNNTSRMSTAAKLREMLYKAKEYQDKLDAAGEDASKKPAYDMKLEALLPVLRGEIPLKAHAHQANDIFTSIRIAKEFGVTLVLKSASTVICDGSNTVINVTGTTALAKGGSGDILAGYICGSLARGLLPFEAAVCSAYVLGRAAEISSKQKGDYCVTAKDIINNLHFSVKSLTE